MKNSKMIEFFQEGNIVIPLYFLKRFNEFNISMQEFIFLMYLYNLGNNIIFDVNKFSNDLNISTPEIMILVSSLTDKNLLSLEVVRNSNTSVMEDVINIDNFFNKLSLITMGEAVQEEKKDIKNSNIFEVIQKEFGRTLSPMEIEISQAWLDSGYSEEIIKEAIKEATFSGVSSLRYIDKILFEWSKNNIKTVEDVEKNRTKRKKETENDKVSQEFEDIIDYDWLADEE